MRNEFKVYHNSVFVNSYFSEERSQAAVNMLKKQTGSLGKASHQIFEVRADGRMREIEIVDEPAVTVCCAACTNKDDIDACLAGNCSLHSTWLAQKLIRLLASKTNELALKTKALRRIRQYCAAELPPQQ